MKKIVVLLFPVILSSCQSQFASSSSYTQEFDLTIKNVYQDGSGKTTQSHISIKSGDDLSSRFENTTLLSDYYLLNIFTDNSGTLVKASELRSYNGTYSMLSFIRCSKQNKSDYLSLFNGTYCNYKGDSLTIEGNNVSWSYSLPNQEKISFSSSVSTANNDQFAPSSDSYYINDSEVSLDTSSEGVLYFEVANYDYYQENDGSYSFKSSLLKNAIIPSPSIMEKSLQKYCSDNNITFEFDDNYSFTTEFCYVANNNVTIDYDL